MIKMPRKRITTKEMNKVHHLKQTYSLSLKEFNNMYKTQNGCCLICKLYYEVLVVDHCHSTLKIRGLLCHKCNMGLGLLKEDDEMISKCINYLNEHQN